LLNRNLKWLLLNFTEKILIYEVNIELNAQIIIKRNINEFAVLLYDEFQKMKEMIKNYEYLMLLRKTKYEYQSKNGKSAESLLAELS
jgi:hypothetical protein